MASEIVLLARAWRVAADRHVNQRRKGKSAEPYVNHLAEVAELAAEATEGDHPHLAAAAVLHDTVEDTRPHSALARFSNQVASVLFRERGGDQRQMLSYLLSVALFLGLR